MQLIPMDLVRGEVDLPSLPDIYRRFTTKLEDPGAKSDDFAEIISSDPSLTTKLLKIVNSAYYSFSSTITDVAHAITIVGLNDLREMMLAISVVDFFDGLPNDLVSMQDFWQHSVLTGLLSKELQDLDLPAVKSKESLFTAGLLHDVGALVFYNRMPEVARAVIELNDRLEQPRYELEKQKLGFDHADIGGALVSHWGLPSFLSEVIESHHLPQKAKTYNEEALVVNMADRLARLSESSDSPVPMLLTEYRECAIEINEPQLLTCLEQANEKLNSVLAAIQPA